MTLRLIEGEAGAGAGNAAVFVDSSVYYQLPPGALPAGGGSSSTSRTSPMRRASTSARSCREARPTRPSTCSGWSALGPGITKIGEEDVRGVPTSRYRATVDLNLLEEQAPPGKEAEWAAYVQTLRDRLGLAFIPVESGWTTKGLVSASTTSTCQHRGDDRGGDDGAFRLRHPGRCDGLADQVVTLNDVIRPGARRSLLIVALEDLAIRPGVR